MDVKKITVGFVVQSYDTETKKFTDQAFIAGDPVTFENEFGEAIDPPEDAVTGYLPFDMVQPQ